MDTTTTTTTATLPLPRTHHNSHSKTRRPRRSSTTTTAAEPTHWHLGNSAQSSLHYSTPPNVTSPQASTDHSSLYERIARPSDVRSRSPDAQSRASAVSKGATSGDGPHLRKKPKSISIKNKPRSKSSGLVETPPAPSFPYASDETAVSSPVQNPANSSKPLSREDPNNPQHHSPIYKRPPASHSSYGVETTCGPPPSYTTQRTFSQERIKKPDRNTILWIPPQDKSSVVLDDSPTSELSPDGTQQFDSNRFEIQSSPVAPENYSVSSLTDMDPMTNVTLREHRQYGGEPVENESKGSSSDERKSEDLFLNIAKVDAARAPVTKSDRRRSRLSIPFLSSNRSTHEMKSSPANANYSPEQRSSQVEEPRYYSKRSSIGHHFSGAVLRSNFGGDGRAGEHNIDSTPVAEKPDYDFGRSTSNAHGEQTRLSQRPSQGLRGQRSMAESNYTGASRVGENIATESTVSTTAPSTVWDELDDLKSRIRKLELTGKLPPSSAAAMSSAERPRTATTVATTMSASPRLKTAGVSLPSAVEGIPSTIHPLLHEALGSARQVISPEIYSKLYATASDALQLAIMVSNEPHSTSQSINANHERQVRRRTENMCRGITELAIALTAESKGSSTVNHRPGSRDQANPPNAMLRSRRYSNDPGERTISSRVASRLDGRRTSLVMGTSPPVLAPTDPALPPLPGLRLGRSSTVTRSRRGPAPFDGADEEMEASPSIRPASRAMTETAVYRRPVRDPVEASREFTNQHPMPRLDSGLATTPLPNNTNANFTSRRKYASPATNIGASYDNSPSTPQDTLSPREGWGKISIVPGEGTPSEVASEMGRAGSGRRSLGFASRIGSSMGSRLRAARTDRGGRESFGDMRNTRDITTVQHGNESAYAS